MPALFLDFCLHFPDHAARLRGLSRLSFGAAVAVGSRSPRDRRRLGHGRYRRIRDAAVLRDGAACAARLQPPCRRVRRTRRSSPDAQRIPPVAEGLAPSRLPGSGAPVRRLLRCTLHRRQGARAKRVVLSPFSRRAAGGDPQWPCPLPPAGSRDSLASRGILRGHRRTPCGWWLPRALPGRDTSSLARSLRTACLARLAGRRRRPVPSAPELDAAHSRATLLP